MMDTSQIPTEDDLLKQQQDYAAQKQRAALVGGIGDALANQQSFGNFYTGHMNPHNDVAGAMKAQSDALVDPLERQKNVLAAYKAAVDRQSTRENLDPNSGISRLKGKQAGLNIEQSIASNPGYFKDNPAAAQGYRDSINGLSGNEIDQVPGMNSMKSGLESGKTILGLQNLTARQEAIGDRRKQNAIHNDLAERRLGMRGDDQAIRAADTFDKDENLKTLQKQQQNITRGKHTLETVKTLTPQLFSEIQMDIANAISGGKSAAVSTQNKTEFESAELAFTNLRQRLSNNPQDIGSPEVKQYIHDVLDRLDGAYQHNMSDRAQQLQVGRDYTHNPAAAEVVKKKVGSYKPAEEPNPDAEALQWAKANKGDPRAAAILLKLSKGAQ